MQRRVREIEKENAIVQSDIRVLWCGKDICEERAADGATVKRRAFRLGEQINDESRYFAADHLGSVRGVTDASGVALAQYAFARGHHLVLSSRECPADHHFIGTKPMGSTDETLATTHPRSRLDTSTFRRPVVLALAFAVCLGIGCGKRPDGLHRDSRPVVDPTHKRAIILSASVMGKSSIYRLQRDDLSVELVVSSKGDSVQPDVSSDGSLIAYVCEQSSGAGRICVVNSDGTNNRAVTNEQDVDERWPAFLSVDHIVFARAALRRSYSMGGHIWDDYDLYDVSLSLGTVRRLTRQSYRQVVGISADSGEVVFSAQPRGGALTVFKMRSNGEVTSVVDGSYPAVGRSSRTLFVRRTAANDESDYFEYEVWLDHNGFQQLTHNRSYDVSPAWGEAADSFIYLSDAGRNQRCTLWESDLAGGRPRQIPVTAAIFRSRR